MVRLPVLKVRSRGGLVFKALRLLFHSTLGSKLMKMMIKKKKVHQPFSKVRGPLTDRGEAGSSQKTDQTHGLGHAHDSVLGVEC